MPRVTRSQAKQPTMAKQSAITAHFGRSSRAHGKAKNLASNKIAGSVESQNVAKRLKTGIHLENTLSEPDSGCASNYQHKLPQRTTLPFQSKLDVDQTSVDGYQIMTPPSTPCSQRVRTTSEGSTCSVATNMSSTSTKENRPPTEFVTPNKRNISAISRPTSTATLTPRTPLNASIKRRRRSEDEERSYDFSKSPKTAAEGLKALSPLLKRNKCSTSPRNKVTSESLAPSVEASTPDFVEKSTPIDVAETPVEAPKKLTLQQRIAAIKAKKLASVKRVEAKAAEASAAPTTPAAEGVAKDMATPKPVNSKIAAIKAKMAAKKLETQLAKEKNEKAKDKVAQVLKKISPILKISEKSRAYIRSSYKELNVDEKLRTLELPKLYKVARTQFKHIDQSVQVLHNRKQNIIAQRVLRNATTVYREHNFTLDGLKTVAGIKDDAYAFSWKKGLRTEDDINELESARIKSDNFQLTMKPVNLVKTDGLGSSNEPPKTPGLGRHEQMTVGHVQERLKDFSRRLLVSVYEKHRAFRAQAKGISEAQEEQEFPLSKLRFWHPGFSLQSCARDLKEFMVEFPPKPVAGQILNNPATPVSGRKLLQSMASSNRRAAASSFVEQTPPPDSAVRPVVSRPDYLDSPEYKSLPKSLQVKYEERMRKAAEKSMLKERQNREGQLDEIKSLYEIARGLKSYYTVTQTLSGSIHTIATQISKTSNTMITAKASVAKIKQLSELKAVKDENLFEIVSMGGGTQMYVKMKPTTKLQQLQDAIDLALERKTRELGL